MKKILLQVPSVHLSKNNVFKQDVNSQSEARIILKEDLKKIGYDFTTADSHSLNDCAWILYLDTLSLDGIYLQQDGIKARVRALLGLRTPRPWPDRPLYQEALKAGLRDKMALILWECKAVNPQNYNPEIWEKFKYIFTWDDDLVDNKKFFKFYHPFSNKTSPQNIPPFSQKKLLVNMSGSKTSHEPNELYSARLKTIEYFTNKYPNDFDLYGGPWNVPRNRIQRTFPWLVKKYKSNRGESMDKIETLSK
ncbi:MAG: hypothetical protein NT098_02485 [Candidatus Parcubacteria bacterium]|nr:hypothetical protein [Candidatus Parcubacteria bacterium]